MEETRADLEQRLQSFVAELPLEQARIPDLELTLRVTIESHINSCHRELSRLEEHQTTAFTGEAELKWVLEAEEALDEARERIESLEGAIEELKEELADEELWPR